MVIITMQNPSDWKAENYARKSQCEGILEKIYRILNHTLNQEIARSLVTHFRNTKIPKEILSIATQINDRDAGRVLWKYSFKYLQIAGELKNRTRNISINLPF